MQPGLLLLEQRDHVPTEVSQAVVYGLHLIVPGAFALYALILLVRTIVRARRADARFAGTRPHQAGPAAVRGRVEIPPGSPVAVRVTIEQTGTESKGKNGWSHVWSETSRKVEAAPFYLRDERGERVRVEPTEQVFLADEPTRTIPGPVDTRTRIVELTADEEVYALGELRPGHDPEARAGYRDPHGALVLQAPPRGRLLLSSGPLGERIRKTAGWPIGFAAVMVVFIAIFQLVDLGFHVRTLAGTPATGTVMNARGIKGSKTSRCELTIRAPDGEVFTADVSFDLCKGIAAGARVPIVHVPGHGSWSQIGQSPSMNFGAAIAAFVFLAIILVFGFAMRDKAWWEAKLIDVGQGRLPRPSEGGKGVQVV